MKDIAYHLVKADIRTEDPVETEENSDIGHEHWRRTWRHWQSTLMTKLAEQE